MALRFRLSSPSSIIFNYRAGETNRAMIAVTMYLPWRTRLTNETSNLIVQIKEIIVGFVTLTTDFGLKDGNVGVMKGVIWGIAPQAQIADLSHHITPQNVPEAALVVLRAAPFFPAGSVHVIVVDPGVGTDRRPIAARLGMQYYVAPDNGVLTMLLERSEGMNETVKVVHLDKPQYWLKEVSHVFHGRDIFAPCGGHLAAGEQLEALGSFIQDPVRLKLPKPQRTASGWSGEVIHVDHFGNISTNIRVENMGEAPGATIRLCETEIQGMVHTFGERPSGTLVALYGSTGNLIVSEVNGSAARRIGARVGDSVEVEL
jgi:S-adenosylmethionine hydrolase